MWLLTRWDEHNQRVLERHARKAREEKPEDFDTSVAVYSGRGALEIGALTFPLGIWLLLLGSWWQRLMAVLILLVGGLCVWSLGRDVLDVVRRRRARSS